MSISDAAEQVLLVRYSLANIDKSEPWFSHILPDILGLSVDESLMLNRGIEAIAAEAVCFSVTEAMTDMIEHAARSLVDEWAGGDTGPEILFVHDVPTTRGIVCFDRSIDLGLGNIEPITGFMWSTGQGVTGDSLTFYPFTSATDLIATADFPQHISHQIRQAGGVQENGLLYDVCAWKFGAPWMVDPSDKVRNRLHHVEQGGVKVLSMAATTGADRSVAFSFFRLLEAHLHRSTATNVPRPAARRLARRKPSNVEPPSESDVRIIDLRNPAPPAGTKNPNPGPGNYSHRWIVEGHWTKHRIATRNHLGEIIGDRSGVEGIDWFHRRRYIPPYVKGPIDKPLVIRDTVKII